jgi:hypothetical protein
VKERLLGVLVLVTAVLGGCGAPDEVTAYTFDDILDEARRAGADRQVAALEGGEISAATIREFERGLDDCYRSHGVWVGEPVVSPIDGWSIIRDSSYDGLDIENDEALNEALGACYEEWEIGFLQMAYEVTHDDVMAEPLLHWMRECCADAGLEVSGDERNARDFAAVDGIQGGNIGAVRGCIESGMAELYPEIPGYTVAY